MPKKRTKKTKDAKGPPAAAKAAAPRFGIGEWYGRSFVHLTEVERAEFAALAQSHTNATAPPCPFMTTTGGGRCSKIGGVCSLRLYEQVAPATGETKVVDGDEGELRVVCPHRFKQEGIIYSEIGCHMLGTPHPEIVGEVRFLQRANAGEQDSQESEDVGNIDNVLVHPNRALLQWCALEIQAVYFSGSKMKLLFEQIESFRYPGHPFPDQSRRPDYRSSGPKRLMPQLQIKVPTLRRWGKKMAVVVDHAWFRNNVIDVATVKDVSNSDIAWFIVTFDESTDPARIVIGQPQLQTLERAVEGLTGGYPVSLGEFETKILEKLDR